MIICKYCGKEFNLAAVKRTVKRLYKTDYDDYFPEHDVCGHCAVEEMSADFGAGEDDIENMGSGWDPD